MKFGFLSLAFLAISCGKIDVTTSGSTTVGESRSVNALSVLSDTDRNNLTSVCNALGTKNSALPTFVGATYSWASATADCDKKVTPELNVETVIQSNGQNYVFKRKDNNQDFIFPNVETNTSGILADACNFLNGLQNPLVSGSTATYYTTTGISSEDCVPTSGEVCVSVETAGRSGDFYIVHTKEWLRVRVSSPTNARIGFVTQRKKVTQGSCGIGEVLEFRASLK